MGNDYKYKGVNLTPKIFAELLIKFFDGKQFDRSTAISVISKYHKENGGIVKNQHGLASTFKTVKSKRIKDGLENISTGIWRLNIKKKNTNIIESEKTAKTPDYKVDKEIGEGNESVYLYYYDTYKELAELKGNYLWECKIGRTDIEPIQRVIGQAGTCFPEYPHIALVIHCEDSHKLEDVLHSIMKYQKKHVESAPGKEWFITSPEEIENLYITILTKSNDGDD